MRTKKKHSTCAVYFLAKKNRLKFCETIFIHSIHKLIDVNFYLLFTGSDDVAIYRRTRKGGIKLLYKQYEYFRTNFMTNGVQAWRCVNFTGNKYEKCTVRAYTELDGATNKVLVNGVHSHPPRIV